jgi:rhamnogalacturonyl hydrolase YesR
MKASSRPWSNEKANEKLQSSRGDGWMLMAKVVKFDDLRLHSTPN